MALTPLDRSGTSKTNKLGGAQTRYARTKKHPYGNIGAPRTVRFSAPFLEKVNLCLAMIAALKPMTSIQLGGAWHDTVAKNKQNPDHGVCRHCQGRAIDIDAIRFHDRALITKNFPWNRKLYLGVESMLRLFFGTVLAYLYNDAHKDHFHCDDGSRPVMRRSDFRGRFCSRVLYLQGACKYVHGFDPGPIDGRWGKKTAKAVARVLCQIGYAGLAEGISPGPRPIAVEVCLRDQGYPVFCKATAYVGLGVVEDVLGARTLV